MKAMAHRWQTPVRDMEISVLLISPLFSPTHTHKPREVPRCGALRLLQKQLHYRGFIRIRSLG
jgi:hypothetical protein